MFKVRQLSDGRWGVYLGDKLIIAFAEREAAETAARYYTEKNTPS